ncbi:antitoxin MazE-like protein [Shewanella glacialipiscicola]|uniref:antitoxin MazE-like protein n=1 Tax=Shewanella glacialipiscicola TaxID=614069 RepID=UPI003D7A9E7A
MSRNKDYEIRQKVKGLKKVTVWVPDTVEVEFKQLAEFCCDNRDYYPSLARHFTTGRVKNFLR